MKDEELKINLSGAGTLIKKTSDLLKNKKVQIGLTILILSVIVILSTMMRLSNLPLLVDHTTGNYTLSDPDALYWMRLENILIQGGNLNGIDSMRYPSLNITYTHELLPYIIADSYKFIHTFNLNITYQFLDAIYPAYAFAISLVIFFFLVYVLTKSKVASLIACGFLAYSPAYLFRTIAGVSGHEALGMLFLFAVFLVFALGLKRFHKNWRQTMVWGAILGIATTYSHAAWGGTINFIFLILPVSLLLYYLFNIEESNLKLKMKFIMFYLIWMITSLLATFLVHLTPSRIYTLFTSSQGILVPFVLAFAIIETLI
ncbi:MAG TPA: STT3 domain-containing protein, partial [Candidatus Omnitrophota bacterium]|nr:STT3 domain-containing protein [Candidatus Omnitrophota bacterium]